MPLYLKKITLCITIAKNPISTGGTMNNKSILLVLPILALVASSIQAYNLLLGSIQFPKTLSTIPQVRIYHSGKIIKCEVDQINKMITFGITQYSQSQIRYPLMITESIEFALSNKTKNDSNNTIQYIRVPHDQDYKFYTLLLVPQFNPNNVMPTYHWKIINDRIRFNNKIPDDAIIICIDPAWVDDLHTDNGFALPTVTIKSDILSICGSYNKFMDKSAQMLLAAIDSDTMHSNTEQTIKLQENRLMIAAPAA